MNDEWLGPTYHAYGRGRYRMATTAIHKLGEISRDAPSLCIIHGETETDYIGQWVTGFGFVKVKFPKETTRKLTRAEADHYDGRRLQVGSVITNPTRIDDEEVEE